ncbi:tyrosine--tRNA ligase [Candidatus Heimdallarchaeota archaeon]|nr:MAG: tyrosine--tRNA ligase [Candidatus Heimdallarchaeota archaeon]
MEDKVSLVVKNTEEVILKKEIQNILEERNKPRTYIGFELSGLVHLGTGIVCGNKMKDLINAGFETIIFLADWHSWINNKLGADMEKITLAGEYFQKAFESVGVKGSKVKYIWGSELAEKITYWEKVVRVAKANSLTRVLRTLPIMGRQSEGDLESAFLFYPAMQVADIYDMEIDLAYGGMDQRKAHMLARDTAEKLGITKPTCIHTPLLTGLQGFGKKMDSETKPDLAEQIDMKMSKSKPETCVFIHDSEEDLFKKITKANCPPKQTLANPITEILQYIVFDQCDEFTIERDEKYGGDITYESFELFKKDYEAGKIHPQDLKHSVARVVNSILKPSRRFFEKHEDLIEEVRNLMNSE